LLDEYAKKFKQDEELFIKTFNLQTTINIKNMVLFSPEGKLKKYNSIEEILETFYELRLKYYHLRKDYMISVLKKEVATLSNKARFIKMVIEDELIIKRKKRAVLVNELYDLKFDTQTMLNEKKQKTKEEINREHELQNSGAKGEGENQNEDNLSDNDQGNQAKDKIKPKVPIKEYDYLLNMNLWSLTHEKIEELLKQKELKEKELSVLEQTEVETLWDNDLDNLEEELTKYENMEEEDRLLAQKLNKVKSGGAMPKRRRNGRKKKNSEGKSEDNDGNNSENTDSNNTSLVSDSTNIVTKKNKTKNKTKKAKKEKGQTSLNNFVKSPNKGKKRKNKENKDDNEIKNSESVSKSSDNEKESSDNDESESNPFNIPLKERLRKKIINIGESPIPLDNLNYGNNVKRDFSDDDSFSDLNLSAFDDKEKVED
jgi:DNA topoisomerase-2